MVVTPLALSLTTHRMLQSGWLNTVAGDAATRAGSSRLTRPLATDRVGQARRNRTIRGVLAFRSNGIGRHLFTIFLHTLK